MKTNKTITLNYKTYGMITIPKGTKVTHNTAIGYDEKYMFVDEFDWIENEMLKHDAIYYGILVDKGDVE